LLLLAYYMWSSLTAMTQLYWIRLWCFSTLYLSLTFLQSIRDYKENISVLSCFLYLFVRSRVFRMNTLYLSTALALLFFSVPLCYVKEPCKWILLKSLGVKFEMYWTLYIFHAPILYSQRINTNLLHCIIYLLVGSLKYFSLT